MSKVNSISSCPACEAELTEDLVGQSCPTCQFVFKSAPNEFFSGPAYIYIQHEEALGKILSSVKDQKKIERDSESILNSHLSWFERCSDEDRIGAVEDAFRVIQTVLHSNASPAITQKVALKAKQIGELGKSIEEYLKSGGYLHGKRIPKPTKTGDNEQGI